MKMSLWRTLVLVLAGLSVGPFARAKAGDDIPFSPFAFLPLREQSYQLSSSGGVKPNIMFLIDDSVSMGDQVIPDGFDFSKYYEPCPAGSEENSYFFKEQKSFSCADTLEGYLHYSVRPLKPNVSTEEIESIQENFKSRMEVTKEALYAILDDPKFKSLFEWSLYSLWGSDAGVTMEADCGTVNKSIGHRCAPESDRMHTFTTAEEVRKRVANLDPVGSTPTTSTFFKVADIVAENIKHVCQKSFIVLMSDGDVSEGSSGFPEGGSFPLAGKSKWYAPIPDKYSSDGGVFGADSEIDYEKGARIYNEKGEVDQEGNGISFFSRQLFYRDIKTAADGVDAEGIGWDEGVEVPDENDKPQTLYKQQNIVTYTVGFGDGLTRGGLRYLQDAASKENGADGQYYFKASTPKELEQAFMSIVKQAKTLSTTTRQSTSTAKPSVAGSRRSEIPALAAFLDLDTKTWSSVLRFAELDAYGNITKDAAGEPVTRDVSYSGRKVLVHDGTSVNFFANGPEYDDYGFKTKKEFDLGFTPWYLRDPDKSDEEIEQAVATNVTAAERTVSKYRKRKKEERMMGDVLDSPVLAMGEDEQTGRDKYLLTAANDGMVYIFKARQDGASPYELALNYLPAAMQRESEDGSDTVGKALKALAEAGYGKTYTEDLEDLSGKQPHLYLNNGGIQYRTTNKRDDGRQMTFVAGAMGQGGRGAYLLAITGKSRVDGNPVGLDADTDNWNTTVPLGETPKGGENALGYTVGTPQIGRVATDWEINTEHREQSKPDITSGVRQYLFLANGYRPADPDILYDEQPTLYVYEALGEEMGTDGARSISEAPGEEIISIPVEDGYGGLSTPVLVDADLDGIFDHAYAGDQGGNLYRFSLIGAPEDWSVVKIYQGETQDNGTGEALPYQPITTKPAVYRRSKSQYIVMAGTGSRIYQSDLDNTDQQVVLGIFDDLTQTPGTPVEQNELVEQTIVSTETTQVDGNQETLRYLSKSPVPQTGKGWVLKLGDHGERMVTDPGTLLSTGFFTTAIFNRASGASGTEATGALTSDAPSCKVQTTTTRTRAQSYLFAIDLKTGGNPSSSSARLPAYENRNKDGDNAAAVQMKGTLSGVVIFSLSEQVKGPPRAIDLNGAGQSGEDDVLGKNDEDRGPVECLESDDYKVMTTSQKGLDVKELAVPICAAALIRVNWREVTP